MSIYAFLVGLLGDRTLLDSLATLAWWLIHGGVLFHWVQFLFIVNVSSEVYGDALCFRLKTSKDTWCFLGFFYVLDSWLQISLSYHIPAHFIPISTRGFLPPPGHLRNLLTINFFLF